MDTLIDAGNDQLWMEDLGGDGPPVVLLHPGIHDSTVWDPVLPLLDGLRIVRFDRRDFGRSHPATSSYRTMDDLVAVLDHLGLGSAHLVGNSMGGETSLALALEQPERVASLTLLAPGITGYPWPDESELEAEYDWLLAAGDHAGLVDFAARLWCAAGVDDALRGQLVAAEGAEENMNRYAERNPEQWSRVHTIGRPTTVVIGELDYRAATAAAVELAGRILTADLVRLPESDHLPSLRAPQRVAEVIRTTVARAA
ncbi:MAG: alpha/beta hydrolase [Actinomycetota bacterium]|nr:alpha/beta hydrolase [Actinomycetota bacterium]